MSRGNVFLHEAIRQALEATTDPAERRKLMEEQLKLVTKADEVTHFTAEIK